ncbi:ImmA/IrrE family metallo-endopeptidase [bacterium]|nr:MAG: ImmA/IrrE family metallo-endopeptidase [bacterium]
MNVSALKRARELRGLSANALAARVGVSQPALSQIESGRINASPETVRKIADALGVPTEFLVRQPRSISDGSFGLFRAHSSKVNQTEGKQIRQLGSVVFEFTEKLAEGIERPEVQIPRIFGEKPALAAEKARNLLGFGSEEPIGNLTRRLERLGVMIVKADLKQDAVFGYSFWANDRVPRPFIALSHHQTPYRLRWTLAHEAGHILLGHEYSATDPKVADQEADQFAAALLVPVEALTEDVFEGVNLSALSRLKARYGVSMAALARRTHDTGLIDHSRYESLVVQMSRLGWRKSEPGDDTAQHEEPILLKQMIEAKYGPGFVPEKVAAHLGYPEDAVFPSMVTTKSFLVSMKLRSLIG